MSGENEKGKHKQYKQKNIIAEYVIRTFIYVLIAMVLAVIAVVAAMKPVSALVHKAEAAMPYSVSDIEIQDENRLVPVDDVYSGDALAKLTCDKRGISCTVFYGLNRASMRNGAGLLSKRSLFGNDDITIVAGYDEGCFSQLKYVEKGDTIIVTTTDKTIKYKVKDAFFDSKSNPSVEKENGALILYSSFSDFSQHSDECFYVLAREVASDE